MVAQVDTKSPPASGGKKRALEALERRFATVRASQPVQEPRHESRKIRKYSAQTGKTHGTMPSSPSQRHPLSGRGNSVSTGCAPLRETSRTAGVESHPAYSELSQAVHENLIPAGAKTSHNGETVSKIVNNLLQSGDKGHKYIRGSRSMKIDNWLLLDNFVPRDNASTNARVKALQSHSKRSMRHMSMRQHRKCGSFDFPKEFHKFDLFKPMHDMWREYIIDILKQTEKKQLAQTLLMADLHGAFLQVVPKTGSVFIFQAGCWKITLHGDKLSLRNVGM